MFSQHVVTPAAFAERFVELLPEYLPGVDTGAFEANRSPKVLEQDAESGADGYRQGR